MIHHKNIVNWMHITNNLIQYILSVIKLKLYKSLNIFFSQTKCFKYIYI